MVIPRFSRGLRSNIAPQNERKFVKQAEACITDTTDTTPNQPHQNSNTHQTKNNTTNVVIQRKKSQAPDDGYINVRNILNT